MKFASAFLALAFVAASCGGSDNGGSSGGDNNDAEGGFSNSQEDAPDPAYGGVLTMGIEAETTGGWCIPTNQFAAGGLQVAQAIYDPLFAFDENLEPQGVLVETLEVNDAGDTFTMKLREGVEFHNGEKLTAQLVKLNLDIWTLSGDAPAVPYQPLLLPVTLLNVGTISVVDEMTVEVTTETPWPAFPDYLATGRAGIAAEEQLMSEDCAENPIGTGPFVAGEGAWVRNEKFTLARNDNYWRTASNGDELPYLDGVTFVPIISSTERGNALSSGSINALQTSTYGTYASFDGEEGFGVYKEPDGNQEVAYGMNNVSQPPFDDKETRKAIGMAIDREELNDINSEGVHRLADQPFDTDVLGHIDGLTLGEYDKEAAAQMLEGKDVSFSLKYAKDPITKLIAESVQTQLGEVGVEVDVEVVEQSALIDIALEGDFNTLLWRNHPGADPDTQYLWWQSDSPTNFGRIDDPVIDEALETGRTSTDPAERKEAYETLNTQMVEEGYFLWNWFSRWAYAFEDNVYNLGVSEMPDGSPGSGLHWGWSDIAGVYIAE